MNRNRAPSADACRFLAWKNERSILATATAKAWTYPGVGKRGDLSGWSQGGAWVPPSKGRMVVGKKLDRFQPITPGLKQRAKQFHLSEVGTSELLNLQGERAPPQTCLESPGGGSWEMVPQSRGGKMGGEGRTHGPETTTINSSQLPIAGGGCKGI